MPQIVAALHVQEPLWIDVEKLAEPERDCCRDVLAAMRDLVDAAARYANRLGKRISLQAHGLEELRLQNLAGMRQSQSGLSGRRRIRHRKRLPLAVFKF